MSVLAVDLGSSRCKAVIFSDDGRVLAQEERPYPSFQTPQPSRAEISADVFWQAFSEVTRATAAEVVNDPVEALGISSHAESFVPVNSRFEAIAPALLNIDNRATAETNFIAEALGRKRLFEITGLTAHPMYSLPKMLWLRRHQPNVFSGARFLAIPSYILARLGLCPYVDYSLASRFLAFDIHQRTWSPEILSACELDPEQFPAVVPAGTIAGELSTAMAATLGLSTGTLVVVGGHDQPCAALGSGVLEPGRISASLGTYECLLAASHAPALSEPALAANLNSYCHVVPERFVTLAYFPAGIMVEWFLRVFCSENGQIPAANFLSKLEADSSHRPSGLCITPHLLGTCNPDFNADATGVISGIRPGTTRADLYRGIVEGIACEFANMACLLREVAGAFTEVYVTGGATRSPLGLKLRASLSGCELHLMECPDTVCLGTAMLAGLAAGKFGSFAEAAEQLVRVSRTVIPDPALGKAYERQMQHYRILYSSLAPLRRAQAECHQEEQ